MFKKNAKKIWVSSIKDRDLCLIPHQEIVLHAPEDRLFWAQSKVKIQSIKTFLESDPVVLRTQLYFFAENMFRLWDQEEYSLKEMKGFIVPLVRQMRQVKEEMPIEAFLSFLSSKTANEDLFGPLLEALLHQLFEMGLDDELLSLKEAIDVLFEGFDIPLNSGFIELSGGKMLRMAANTATFFEGVFGENFVEKTLSIYLSSKVYIRTEKTVFNEGLLYLISIAPATKNKLVEVLSDPFLTYAFKEHGFRALWLHFLTMQNSKNGGMVPSEVLELCFVALELFDYLGLKNEFLIQQLKVFFDCLLTRTDLPSLEIKSVEALLTRSQFWGWERVFQVFLHQTLQRWVLSDCKDAVSKNLMESFMGIESSDAAEELVRKITLSPEYIAPLCALMENEVFIRPKKAFSHPFLITSPKFFSKVLEKPGLYRGAKQFVYYDRAGMLFKDPKDSMEKGLFRKIFDLASALGVEEVTFHLCGETFSDKTGIIWDYFLGLIGDRLNGKGSSLQAVSCVFLERPSEKFMSICREIVSVESFGLACVFKKKIES